MFFEWIIRSSCLILLSYHLKNYGNRGGCYPPTPYSASQASTGFCIRSDVRRLNTCKISSLFPVRVTKMMKLQNRPGNYITSTFINSKARFRRRTFHEPILIHWNKYMKSSASESILSIRNACFNLKRPSRSFRQAQPGISPFERLWHSFDSDAELFM